jgi:hypothetical protein
LLWAIFWSVRAFRQLCALDLIPKPAVHEFLVFPTCLIDIIFSPWSLVSSHGLNSNLKKVTFPVIDSFEGQSQVWTDNFFELSTTYAHTLTFVTSPIKTPPKERKKIGLCHPNPNAIYKNPLRHAISISLHRFHSMTTPSSASNVPHVYNGRPPMKSLHGLTSLGIPSLLGSFSLMHWAKSTAVCHQISCLC